MSYLVSEWLYKACIISRGINCVNIQKRVSALLYYLETTHAITTGTMHKI